MKDGTDSNVIIHSQANNNGHDTNTLSILNMNNSQNNSSVAKPMNENKNNIFTYGKRSNTKFNKRGDTIQADPDAEVIEEEDNSSCLKKNKKQIIIITGVVLLITIVILLVVLLLKKKDDKKEEYYEVSHQLFANGGIYITIIQSEAKGNFNINIIIRKGSIFEDVSDNPNDNKNIIIQYNDTSLTSFGKVFNLEQGRYTATVDVSGALGSKTDSFEFYMINSPTNEIVIAPLEGTMPVTLFTLNLKEISNDYTMPVYVFLERTQSWDYDYLPENIFLLPSIKSEDVLKQTNNLEYVFQNTAIWVKTLHSQYQQIKIHFYMSDFTSLPWMTIALNSSLSSDEFDMHFLYMGTGTYQEINKLLDKADWKDYYDNNLTKVYDDYRSTFSSSNIIDVKNDNRSFALCLMSLYREKNFTYWIGDTSMMAYETQTDPNGVYKQLIEPCINDGRIVQKSLGTMFANLDQTEKDKILKLYKFNSDMFEKAVQEEKDVMIFLGSYTYKEELIDYYMKACIKYYGHDNFTYYYKGHPRDKAVLEYKRKRFESFGVYWLEASIPAELIYFFANGIKISDNFIIYSYWGGYQSSTFDTIDDKYALFMWAPINYPILDQATELKMDIFMTYINQTEGFESGTDLFSEYRGFLNGGDGIVFNYTKTQTNYDTSLYIITNDTIINLKKDSGGALVQV